MSIRTAKPIAANWTTTDEITPTNISQPMSLSIWISRALSRSIRYAAVWKTISGMMNSSESSPAETTWMMVSTGRGPSIRFICTAITAAKGTSSAEANSVSTIPSRIRSVFPL